jgi:hypothetical protein
MMLDQWFGTAAIHPTVMPIGVQDSPSLLEWTVGGTAARAPTPAKLLAGWKSAQTLDAAADFYIPREHLVACGCSSCPQP